MEASIRIEEVKTKKQFNLFFKFPYMLFKDDKDWVPQILMDEKGTFNRKKNPAFEFCDYRMFLAYKNERLVGRVAGILNNKSNEIWNQKRLRFGWLDYENDKDVVKALMNAAESWARELGMTEVVGPMGFTDMDKEGMIVEKVEGVDSPMACYYNPLYYAGLIESAGYEKEVDWLQYEIPASQPIPEKIAKINALIKEKYSLRIVDRLTKRQVIKQYGEKIFKVVNKSFSGLFGYVPLNEKQIKYYISQYFSFIDLKLVCFIVDEKDDVVAFGVSMPSFSNALRKCKGKLFPFGWYYLLKSLKNYEYIDLYLNGVDPDWQNKGVHSIYYAEMNRRYIELGAKMAIANPQLETNQASQIWEKYDSKVAIRRRAYIKRIN